MFRLNRLTDYAFVVLSHLSRTSGGEPESVAEIALGTGIPAPTVAKVLKMLGRAGLVVSRRGVQGGYSLVRSPMCIDLAEIIEAMDGPFALTGCSVAEIADCADEPHCQLAGHWTLINRTVRAALSGVSLADLARPHAFSAGK